MTDLSAILASLIVESLMAFVGVIFTGLKDAFLSSIQRTLRKP
jgi:hypothetical protein